ncbi:foldase protein PrsA [Roseobacteraceae bacterium S113]
MMLKSLRTAACVAALTIPATTAFAQSADDVMATVNGTEITLGHMILVRNGLPEQYQSVDNEVLWTAILDQLIQQTALLQTGPEERTKRLQIALENEERALRAAAAIQEISEEAISDEAVRAAYNAQFAGEGSTEWNASHILVSTEEEAAALTAEAQGGADFAELAREHSTGPSGPNGGQLGWFGKGMMVPTFEQAVSELEIGDVAGPVQSQFGWHVIKLNDSRIDEAPTIDEARDEIERNLQNAAIESQLEELMDIAAISRTDVSEVDPEILSDMSLVEK